jgi:hypothetical protein
MVCYSESFTSLHSEATYAALPLSVISIVQHNQTVHSSYNYRLININKIM